MNQIIGIVAIALMFGFMVVKALLSDRALKGNHKTAKARVLMVKTLRNSGNSVFVNFEFLDKKVTAKTRLLHR